MKSGNPEKIKEAVVTIVEETLTEPRAGSLEGVSDTVKILVRECINEVDVIKQLIDMSPNGYSTVLHSINVMAFALAFASYYRYSEEDAKKLGLCALLHDVGKTKINQELLTAPRKLTNAEFQEIKSHTTTGYQILRECDFDTKEISIGALEHHEKLDGSGYPNNKTAISPIAQIIGLIDCYEALTNDDRPYRNSMNAFETLGQIIKKDVKNGKYSAELYTQFVKSLGAMMKQ
ncbi:HD-GYP domain-containing protein [Thermodesulfobacteriota bacterium]